MAAQYLTTNVLAESPQPADAVPKILRAVCDSLGWELGVMWRVDARENVLRCAELWHAPAAPVAAFAALTRSVTFTPGNTRPRPPPTTTS